MTSKLTREERIQSLYDLKIGQALNQSNIESIKMLARMALAAMDSEPVELPLDYLQGHKDGLEWSARLAESNHPQTGDWLYDDPIELAKAIRKGPDMPPAQLVAAMDGEPVVYASEETLAYAAHGEFLLRVLSQPAGDAIIPLYRHAQPAPVVPDEKDKTVDADDHPLLWSFNEGWNACRAAMLAAAQHDTPALNSVQSVVTVPGKWIPVSERMPDEGETVLGCCGLNGRHSGIYTMRASVIHRKNSAIDTYGIKHERVTHWMPLPAAPQEVK